MAGLVPWRCLVPSDAVSFLIGKGGANIRQLCESSGAEVAVSKEGETPETLSDKIVTFRGLVDQKEAVCSQVVRKLRQMQGVNDYEPGVFVIIIPMISAPVIIGAKGASIRSIMEMSGAEINVGREAILGMTDQPISINGTLDQVVSAVSKLNAVLQDMCDRGKLSDRDFIYKPEESATSASAGLSAPTAAGGGAAASGMAPAYNNSNANDPPGLAPPYNAAAAANTSSRPPNPGGAVGGFGHGSGGGVNGHASAAAPAPSGFAAQNGSAADTGFFQSGSTGNSSAGLGQGYGTSGGNLSQSGGGFGNPAHNNSAAAAAAPNGSSSQQHGCCAAPSGNLNNSNNAMGNAHVSNGNAGNYGQGPGQAAHGIVNNSGLSHQNNNNCSTPGTPSVRADSGRGGHGGPGVGQAEGLGFGGAGGTGMGVGAGACGLGGLGMLTNPLAGMIGSSNNERAFLAALQNSGINNAQLTLLIPQALIMNVLIPRGIMMEIVQRSGSKIDLGAETPAGMRQVTLSGSMVGNALASLFLQEKVIQFQQMGQQMGM